MESELQLLNPLVRDLKSCRDDAERIEVLNKEARVMKKQPQWNALKVVFSASQKGWELIVKSLIAIDQGSLLSFSENETEKAEKFIEDLLPVESFYKEMGGIVGYHWMMLSLLKDKKESEGGKPFSESECTYHRPLGLDLSTANEEVQSLILEGIVSLPFLAEMYPVGGAADRLKLCDATGHTLPSAKLEFCGYTLLERLIRDLQAREYLYYKIFGEQIITPVALMTSCEKHNHAYIVELCELNRWFGRPKERFRIFRQPMVPTMDRKGNWCMSSGKQLLMKPGGHGVIWKLAKKEAVFDWMHLQGREKVLVRQINNPIAGIDYGLLAFCGMGFRDQEIFGFASCERRVGSAEGINVLIEKKTRDKKSYCLTCIEYCDFSKFSIEDSSLDGNSCYSRFPSNTNILFADIAKVEEAVEICPIPGMLVNLKNTSFIDEEGNAHEQEIARLESTMQNLADCFEETVDAKIELKNRKLKTYLTYNERKKTISTIKKLLHESSSLLETPEGCFYDFLLNAYDLLTNYCHMQVPRVPEATSYPKEGPSFLFSYHPALGPLFSIIGQKIQGGVIHPHSELKLEIADAHIKNLRLSGALHVHAEQIMGENQGILKYSDRVGSIRLSNVKVENRGYDPCAENVYWKEEIARLEVCEIFILGDGEFIAENVTLRGKMRIEVEAGSTVIAFEEGGILKFRKEENKGYKKWIYHLEDEGSIRLESFA